MREIWAGPLLVAVILVLGTPLDPVAGAVHPEDGLTTSWPIDTSGLGQIAADLGAVRIRPSDSMTGVYLKAESMTVEMDWKKGYDTRPDDPLVRYTTERGSERVVLDDADVRFEPFQGEPLFLPFNDEAGMNLSATTDFGFTFAADVDPTVVAVGQSPNSVTAGDGQPLGFWYMPEGPLIQGEGRSSVTMKGDFSLFVNNVTIDARGANTDWSEWTGQWHESSDQPVSEVEQRVTLIHVENGTFFSLTKDDVTLFTPALSADFEGTVTSSQVTGRLMHERKVHLFEKDPFRIDGSGLLALDADKAQGEGPHLSADAWGAFEVQGASQIENFPEEETPPSPGAGFLGLAGALMVAALVVTAPLMVFGIMPAPVARVRRRLYDYWMKRGRYEYAEGSWAKAARYFEKATRVKKDEPLAWYEWAHIELELGHAARADLIALEALKVPGTDRFDILDLRAGVAIEQDNWALFNEYLSQLVKEAPHMAHRLVQEMGITIDKLKPELRETLGPSTLEGDLTGYA